MNLNVKVMLVLGGNFSHHWNTGLEEDMFFLVPRVEEKMLLYSVSVTFPVLQFNCKLN
jgi:hypothetical protein